MILELKAIFKDRLIRFMLFVSLCLSIYGAYNMYDYINSSNEELYYKYQGEYIIFQKSMGDGIRPGAFLTAARGDENYWKYNLFRMNRARELSQLYKEGYKANQDRIDELDFLFNLAHMQLHTAPDSGAYPTVIYAEQLEKYLKEDLPFSLDEIAEHSVEYNTISSENMYRNFKLKLERYFNLRDRGLKEVNFRVESPWTYLYYTYFDNDLKACLFLATMAIVSAYIMTVYRRVKQSDLIELRPKRKIWSLMRYIALSFMTTAIIVFLPDIIMVVFLGIRHGFYGYDYPMYVFDKGLNTFNTYANIGKDYLRNRERVEHLVVGLSYLSPIKYMKHNSWYYFSYEIMEIPFYAFIFLSATIACLKLIFYSVVGVLAGVLIKNKILAILVSSAFTAIVVVSLNVSEIATKYNPLSIQSGWNVTLGWTNMSWLNAVLLLMLSVAMVTAVGAVIFERSQMR